MTSHDFSKHLETTPPAQVYLFIGDSSPLMEEAWQKLVEKIVPAGARRFNGERVSAKDFSASDMAARLSTLPMFGSRQLLMVKDFEAWPKDQKNILLRYLSAPSPTACLVLTTSAKKGMENIVSAVEATGRVFQFRPPSGRDLLRWLQDRAKRLGKTLDARAAHFLAEHAGPDLFGLESELDKLVDYTGKSETIRVEDVRQSVSCRRTFSIFELLGYVGRHQTRQAVESLRSLLLAGEAPLGILALLTRQVRHLWQVKDALEAGIPALQISRQLNLPQFVVNTCAQQAPLISTTRLAGMHHAIREADVAMKSTRSSPELVLEMLVLELCTERDRPGGF